MNDIESDWNEYEAVYDDQTSNLSRLISIIPTKDIATRQELSEEGNNCVISANRAIDDMTKLLRMNRSMSRDQTEKYRQKLKLFKNSLVSQQRDLQRAMNEQRGPSSGGLHGYNDNSNDRYSKEERKKLLHGNEVIDNTSNALMRSKQVVAQTEELAKDTSGRLYEQGGQLENVLTDLQETNATSDRARRVMIGMARRVYTDRIIQFVIVFLELGIIGFLVYWKFIKK